MSPEAKAVADLYLPPLKIVMYQNLNGITCSFKNNYIKSLNIGIYNTFAYSIVLGEVMTNEICRR